MSKTEIKNMVKDLFNQEKEDHQNDMYERVIDHFEKELIKTTLISCFGNQTKAASMLGLHRTTLRKKIARHRLVSYTNARSDYI